MLIEFKESMTENVVTLEKTEISRSHFKKACTKKEVNEVEHQFLL